MRRKFINPTIGMIVEERRRERKMTQGELAEATGLSRTYIGLVERGENLPSDQTLRKIEEALGLPMNSLSSKKTELVLDSHVETTVEEIKRELLRRDLSAGEMQIVWKVTCVLADALESLE